MRGQFKDALSFLASPPTRYQGRMQKLHDYIEGLPSHDEYGVAMDHQHGENCRGSCEACPQKQPDHISGYMCIKPCRMCDYTCCNEGCFNILSKGTEVYNQLHYCGPCMTPYVRVGSSKNLNEDERPFVELPKTGNLSGGVGSSQSDSDEDKRAFRPKTGNLSGSYKTPVFSDSDLSFDPSSPDSDSSTSVHSSDSDSSTIYSTSAHSSDPDSSTIYSTSAHSNESQQAPKHKKRPRKAAK